MNLTIAEASAAGLAHRTMCRARRTTPRGVAPRNRHLGAGSGCLTAELIDSLGSRPAATARSGGALPA